MAMWSPDYDIIVETLTGSEFEVTVRETDTIGYLKYRIKKYEGIPVSQQHILFNQAELKDSTVLKDVPLGRGSRLTLVLGMRGGPISARRVVADCDNWFDLSDVLNGTNNRGQLAPIEPLTISTTGVKVLLYKDCKKNINRLMKLRKHHLHSHGASGVTGTSMTGMKGSASGGFSARTQLKFLDKNLPVGENGIAAAEPQDQQWLLDNITTLKKMKNVRQSLEAKKKKKPRPNDPQAFYDEFAQDLRDVQMDLEMHEKLQRWLHRVASNATHLSDAETVPHHQPPSPKLPPNLFDRVRRKSAGTAADRAEAEGGGESAIASSRTDGFMHHPFSRAASLGGGGGAVVGGARKKDAYPSMASSSSGGGAATAMIASSAYSIPVDEFALIARDYRKAAAAVALNKLSDMVDNDENEDQYTKLSAEEIDRRLEAANGEIAGDEMEGMKKRRESNSQFEERLLTQFYDSSSTKYENMFRAYASTERSSLVGGVRDTGSSSIVDQKMVSKFRWRFHSETDGASGATAPEESDQFLNSLLLKRNKTATRPLPPAGYDYRRWADTVQGRSEEVCGKEPETSELTEVATVIIGKAEENSEEESLLEAACSDILNDPEAFDEEDEQLKEVHDNRFQLIDLMGLDSSGDSDSGGEFSLLKNEDFFDLEDEDEGHTDRTGGRGEAEDEDPVLLYEEEDTGSVAFVGGGRRKEFWPHFDNDRRDAAKEEIEEPLAMALPGPSSTSAATADDVSDEEEGAPNCSENEGLEFDDFAYFPTPSPFQSNAFRKQSLSLRPTIGQNGARKAPLLPRISSGGEGSAKEAKRCLMAVNHLGGECVVGPSFPEIISRGALGSQRRHEGTVNYSSLEHMSPGGGASAVKREREQAPPQQQKAHKVQLPDIKLLESDLKRMGLDTILNDSDDSFERTIKKHLRSEESVAYGECLLRSGNEEAKKPAGGENSEWLIQVAVNSDEKQRAANRCAKCNKKLGIIMIMKCHCGLFFCAQHRYAEAHDCSYDFKEEGKRILTKDNPLVVGEKLPKI